MDAAERPGPADVLVNATSVGLRPHDSLEGLPLVDARVVVDLVYGDGPRRSRAGPRNAARASSTDSRCSSAREPAASPCWTGREAPSMS